MESIIGIFEYSWNIIVVELVRSIAFTLYIGD